jgi:hypothetical protein
MDPMRSMYLLAALIASALPAIACAQTYPARPIRMLFSFPMVTRCS